MLKKIAGNNESININYSFMVQFVKFLLAVIFLTVFPSPCHAHTVATCYSRGRPTIMHTLLYDPFDFLTAPVI